MYTDEVPRFEMCIGSSHRWFDLFTHKHTLNMLFAKTLDSRQTTADCFGVICDMNTLRPFHHWFSFLAQRLVSSLILNTSAK